MRRAINSLQIITKVTATIEYQPGEEVIEYSEYGFDGPKGSP
jgi:hypothetical protein